MLEHLNYFDKKLEKLDQVRKVREEIANISKEFFKTKEELYALSLKNSEIDNPTIVRTELLAAKTMYDTDWRYNLNCEAEIDLVKNSRAAVQKAYEMFEEELEEGTNSDNN